MVIRDSKEGGSAQKKPLPPKENSGGIERIIVRATCAGDLAGAAGRTAGTLLHAREHEALRFHKIDAGRVQHVVRTLFKKELEPVLLNRNVAL